MERAVYAFGPQHRAELLRRQLAVLVGVGRMERRLGVHPLAGARAHCERWSRGSAALCANTTEPGQRLPSRRVQEENNLQK